MPDDSSSSPAETGGRLWRGLRGLLFGDDNEPTLRDQIEEAIEEREGDAPSAGDLSGIERQMLRNLLHFGERTVREVAVPRGDILAVPETISFDELVARFAEAGHSRMPVYRDDLDSVIGMVHVNDVFAILATGAAPPATIAPLMREPRYEPESMGVLDLLAEMRATRTHLAIVVDEYSGTEGLVTIEDLVEEIVGDIEDEHDEELPDMLVLEDVAETIDPRLGAEEAGVDTIGGLAGLLAGHIPRVGEMLLHRSGWKLEVTGADARRITRLRLHPSPPPMEPEVDK